MEQKTTFTNYETKITYRADFDALHSLTVAPTRNLGQHFLIHTYTRTPLDHGLDPVTTLLMFLLFFEDEDKRIGCKQRIKPFLFMIMTYYLPTHTSPGTTLLFVMPLPLLYIHTYTRVTSFLFNVWLFLFVISLLLHGSHTLLAFTCFRYSFLSPKEWNGIGWGGKRDLEYG